MINVNEFYDSSATEQWFTMQLRQGSIHDNLKSRGFTLIDREKLRSEYKDLKAPVSTANLSYANKIPAPHPNFEHQFILGRAYDLKSGRQGSKAVSELLTNWMETMPGDTHYLMSLHPSSYLLAKCKSVTFEDIFNITRVWGVDCFIGVFDETAKMMFVYAEEYGVVHVSVDPSMELTKKEDVKNKFDSDVREGIVKKLEYITSGETIRLNEYYKAVITPYL